jgi:hypothetical protein
MLALRKSVSWEELVINAIGFLVAVAAVSAVIFVLTTRVDNVRARSRDSSSNDGGSSSDSWSTATWIAYSSSSGTSAADSGSCATGSSDSGSFDSGCGGGSG